MQAAQRGVVETGADLARVDQVAALVVAEHQGAQLDATALGTGVAPYHELLIAHAFELQPVLRATALVGGVGPLGDHSLVPAFTCAPVGGDPVPDAVRRTAQRVGEVDRSAQQPLSPQERHLDGGHAVEMQEVEHVVEDTHRRRPGHVGVGEAQPTLQPGEAGPPAVEGHHLSVHDEPRDRLGGKRIHQFGIGSIERLTITRHQPHPIAVAERQASHAVELALEDPVRIGEPVVGEGGQGGRAPVGHRFVVQRFAHRTGQAREVRHAD